MKFLRCSAFCLMIVFGAAISASAQKQEDPKKPPPKPSPPVIVVNPDKGKPPPKDRPKDNDEGRKRPEFYFLSTTLNEETSGE